VLDEPMSGLDPLGRKLMADIIRRLKEEGKTVFFSSHILHDVEDLCDRVGIIAKGRLRLVARLADLLAVPSRGWIMSVKDAPEVLRSRLTEFEPAYSPRGTFTEIRIPEKDLGKVMDRLGSFQSEVVSVKPWRPTLEEIVLREIQQTDGNVG
ncbi:MAG TPA: ABC transporter ATP-binding protein, partial [Methylomirabilota bacterium]|nr:ABC transporter ATP-binding protein [Methylomirabilota bacterium]